MSTQISFALHREGKEINSSLMVLDTILMVVGYKIMMLHQQFLYARESLFPLSTHDTITTNNWYRCVIPFDDCRCSMVSTKSDTSIKCITDAQAMNSHIMPLIAYMIHLYIIYKCVSITENTAVFLQIYFGLLPCWFSSLLQLPSMEAVARIRIPVQLFPSRACLCHVSLLL